MVKLKLVKLLKQYLLLLLRRLIQQQVRLLLSCGCCPLTRRQPGVASSRPPISDEIWHRQEPIVETLTVYDVRLTLLLSRLSYDKS